MNRLIFLLTSRYLNWRYCQLKRGTIVIWLIHHRAIAEGRTKADLIIGRVRSVEHMFFVYTATSDVFECDAEYSIHQSDSLQLIWSTIPIILS